MSQRDRVRFSLVNQEACDTVSIWNSRTFLVRRLLTRFFSSQPDIARFRLLQHEYGILISGSSVLQFFDNIVYPGADLDLYVELARVMPLVEFLRDTGYTFRPTLRQPPHFEDALAQAVSKIPGVDELEGVDAAEFLQWEGYVGNGIATVFNFDHTHTDGRYIQIITTQRSPFEVMLHFHSTCVMNVISHSYAYALFPRATFLDRISVQGPILSYRDNHVRAREKYLERGWKMVPVPSAQTFLRKCGELADGVRRVGDEECWTIPLEPLYDHRDQDSIPYEHRWAIRLLPVSPKADEVRANSWTNDSTTRLGSFKIKFRVVVAPMMLRYTYSVSPELRNHLEQYLHRKCATARLGSHPGGQGQILGGEDSGLANLIRRQCKSLRAERLATANGDFAGFDGEEREAQVRARITVRQAFEYMPSFPEVPYPLHPTAATVRKLESVLLELFAGLRYDPDPIFQFHVLPQGGNAAEQSEGAGLVPAPGIWTYVNVSPPVRPFTALTNGGHIVGRYPRVTMTIDESWVEKLKRYRIHLWTS